MFNKKTIVKYKTTVLNIGIANFAQKDTVNDLILDSCSYSDVS